MKKILKNYLDMYKKNYIFKEIDNISDIMLREMKSSSKPKAQYTAITILGVNEEQSNNKQIIIG